MCELTVLNLGGAVPGFEFQYHGAFQHAMYNSKAIYMRLLMKKITWLKDAEIYNGFGKLVWLNLTN